MPSFSRLGPQPECCIRRWSASAWVVANPNFTGGSSCSSKNPPLESRPPRLWSVSVTCAALLLVATVAALSTSPKAVAQGESAAECRASQAQEPAPEKVDFTIGPNKFPPGDKVTIKEVYATLGTFGKGDTVTVKGTYTLASRKEAIMGFYVTQDANDPPSFAPATQISIKAGSASFELTHQIVCRGHLHISFYPADYGQSFGSIYFGTKSQMAEIAHGYMNDIVDKAASDFQTASGQSRFCAAAPFTAKFPGNITVELLGVSEHPSRVKSWWRPDGSPLAEPPCDPVKGSVKWRSRSRGTRVCLAMAQSAFGAGRPRGLVRAGVQRILRRPVKTFWQGGPRT